MEEQRTSTPPTNYQLPISYTFAPGHGVLTVRMGISGEPGYLESRARKIEGTPACATLFGNSHTFSF